jgi:hypothetical protein
MNNVNTNAKLTHKRTTLGVIVLLIALTFIGQIGFLISMLLMLLVFKYQKKSFADIGLKKPRSWIRTVLLGVLLALGILLFFLSVLNPIIQEFFPIVEKDITRFASLKGNTPLFIVGILSAVITAGFGEEIIWRGYILKNLAFLFGGKKISWVLALLITSVVFGLLHFYQGPVGVIQTGITGFFLGLIFIYNGKQRLWLNIVVHSVIDCISLTAIYMGAI